MVPTSRAREFILQLQMDIVQSTLYSLILVDTNVEVIFIMGMILLDNKQI